MRSQQSELVLGTKVKRILESITGTKYVLKSGDELVHQDGTLWYIHLPLDSPEGWIDNVRQKGDIIAFKSPLVYDVSNVMGFEYRKALMDKKVRDQIDKLGDKTVRRRYSRRIPGVVRFFNSVEELVSDINERYPGSFSWLNDHGMVTISLTASASEVSKDDSALVVKLAAMRELLRQVEKLSR
jgi:hypothetical protein